MPKLIYQDPDLGQEVVVEITAELPEITIGRNPGNIIRINNPSVSRRHTKFVYEGQGCTVYDLNSSNGTYVNGMRVQSQPLKNGDRVRVGEFPLEFLDEAGGATRERAATNLGMGYSNGSEGAGFAMGFDEDYAGGLDQATAAASGHEEYDESPLVLSDDDFQVIEEDEDFPDAEDDPLAFIRSSSGSVAGPGDTVDGDHDIAASLAALGGPATSGSEHDGLFGKSVPFQAEPADEHLQSLGGWSEPDIEPSLEAAVEPSIEFVAEPSADTAAL
ncbi:MAG: FHA domain-containing protein, partial [Bradymonadaceae bacterium]